MLFSTQPYLLFSLFAFAVVDVVVVYCNVVKVVKVVIAVDDTGEVVESFVVAVPIKSFLSYMLKIAVALGTPNLESFGSFSLVPGEFTGNHDS